uniref:Odorant Binding Protein n=1 Tax=Epiphyas postvittana TaxID=65032 RepID=A0A0K8TVI5_EPIPO
MYFKFCFLAFVVLCLKSSMGDSSEEYKLKYVNYILECSKEFPITSEDILKLRKKEVPTAENVKCLLACGYKKSGMMDADGKLSPEGIQKISDEVFADQPELKQRSEEFTNACKFVNDEDIAGDKKDCERAAMIFKCSVERAAEFDFTS